MASTRRANKVADVVWRCLAYSLQKSVADPRLQTLTITGVDVSTDLRHARVYVSMHDEGNKEEMMAALEKAGPYLRRLVSSETELRVAPALHFYYDESVTHGFHISKLIDSVDLGDSDDSEDEQGQGDDKESTAD